jgi:hypothetical protein
MVIAATLFTNYRFIHRRMSSIDRWRQLWKCGVSIVHTLKILQSSHVSSVDFLFLHLYAHHSFLLLPSQLLIHTSMLLVLL